MPGKVILGAQWGDEGKGKFIDIFAGKADLVVRSQGGNNAGHTVVAGGEKYKLQLIPSGILYPECVNVIGPGVVVNPKAVLGEIDGLHEKGVSTDKLFIDARCHCIMPWHLELDALSDGLSADGSTLTADLRAVNDQMNAVVNLCLDIFVDMTDADASDIFEDTSDENIDAVTFGKVRGCTNHGAVDADLNVGGIAGAMAIEYELDPEGDQKESSSVFDRVYETKAVVQHCVNRGSISGKKDCIGGIVGEMDLVLSPAVYWAVEHGTSIFKELRKQVYLIKNRGK